MIDYEYLKQNREHILNRTANTGGSYSIPLSRIHFGYDEPLSYHVPYNLSQEEFLSRWDEIQQALTGNHEIAHFIQSWSTTIGLIQFFYILNQHNQLSHIWEKGAYKIPLEAHFEDLLRNSQNRELNDGEQKFLRWYLGYKYQELNFQWLSGTIDPHNIKISKESNLITEIPNTFLTFDLGFIERNLDLAYGLEGKRYSIYNCFSMEGESKGKGNNIVTGIGARHLAECFAQTVEFEHLIWFNREFAEHIIQNWIFNDNALYYNLPFRLMLQVSNLSSKGKVGLPWAHLRVFIDLSLMYSDFLFLEDTAPKNRDITKRLDLLKVNPGITYFKVLQAFSTLDPLRNHDDDIFRLYDELCRTLQIPPLDKMLKKLLVLIEAFLDYQFKEGSVGRSYLLTAHDLVKRKIEDPLLFINDIIYVDKLGTLLNAVGKHLAVYSKSSFSERDGTPSMIMETRLDIDNQVKTSKQIACPVFRDYEICIRQRDKDKICGKNEYTNKFDQECPIGKYADLWISGASSAQ